MKRPPFEMDGPHYGRQARRRAAVRWVVATALVLAAAGARIYWGPLP
ncbi:MAG: hypothetical protein LBJ15_11240 [Comamonas sp.]|jgi:hypothetical protein|nr:hypothetical protein [Comamonas sp.]MDR0214565.1 hypothetical protein [Comamonas sp.]